jgi:SAM-dependent methyltransferase
VLYDRIGRSYVATRAEDPRIAAAIHAALGDAGTVLNVGAGAGSYEPRDRDVTAIEPSAVMRAQRPPGAAPCIDARAEALPFEDRSFDATMAVLSDHHWEDRLAGLRELRRVGRRGVVFQWDPAWRTRSGCRATICLPSPVPRASRSPRQASRSEPRAPSECRSRTTAATAS